MLLDNRYEVIQSLGSGGFGEAFMAEDTQMPSRRRCVIKKLHPQVQDPSVFNLIRDRFQREAAILEDLGKHDQIPTLYAYFEADGDFYLAQELIEGETLAHYIHTRGPQGESFIRQVLLELLEALIFVHSKNIIHRDINPNNIMIRKRDQKPVLIDFGAVKELMSSTLNTSGTITTSIVIGTPGFMSSEQAAGRPVFSSDLYALVLTAIYALTGQLPQDLGTDYQTGEVQWTHLCPSLSPTLGAIFKRAIDPNPQHRYSTAAHLQAALLQGTVDPVQTAPQVSPASIAPPTAPPVAAARIGSETVISASSPTQKTVVSPNPPASTLGTPGPQGDWLKTLVIAGSVAGSIILGFWMLANSTSGDSPVVTASPTSPPTPEPEPTPPPTPEPTPTPTPEPTPTPPPTPEPTPTPTSGLGQIRTDDQGVSQSSYQQQVEAQLSLARLALGLGDYTPSHDNFSSTLEGGQRETLTVYLEEGQQYSIVGACDEDCSDLDLVLYDDNNNEIDTDTEPDDFPIVEVSPAWSATFSVEVHMYNCSTPNCVYGIGVFSTSAR
ncbi:MAG: protein kinase domain-containing protein [Prochlorothrix sp.]|nr:serine/threonine-protein kinase [Prochlorothrix sp.]